MLDADVFVKAAEHIVEHPYSGFCCTQIDRAHSPIIYHSMERMKFEEYFKPEDVPVYDSWYGDRCGKHNQQTRSIALLLCAEIVRLDADVFVKAAEIIMNGDLKYEFACESISEALPEPFGYTSESEYHDFFHETFDPHDGNVAYFASHPNDYARTNDRTKKLDQQTRTIALLLCAEIVS